VQDGPHDIRWVVGETLDESRIRVEELDSNALLGEGVGDPAA
jgi:hypothetical protein